MPSDIHCGQQIKLEDDWTHATDVVIKKKTELSIEILILHPLTSDFIYLQPNLTEIFLLTITESQQTTVNRSCATL
jgi:hypothetical protein